jgi:hypothetical protein
MTSEGIETGLQQMDLDTERLYAERLYTEGPLYSRALIQKGRL